MKMLYKRRGGPILNWDSGYPPHGYRAAETRGLGNIETYVPDYRLPGAPEPIAGLIEDAKSMQGAAGAAIGAFHGFRRNHGSLMWTGVWALAGMLFPLGTGVVAFAQGFAKPKGSGSSGATLHHHASGKSVKV